MTELVGLIQTPAAAGGAGVATATVTHPTIVKGRVVAVYIKYLDSPPGATTDVTIETSGVNHPAMTILSVANAATDGWFFPKTASHLNTSGAAIADNYVDGVPVHDTVKVTIAQANASDYVQVWLMVE